MNTIFQNPKLADILRIVGENNLPTDDLSETNLEHFFGIGSEEKTKGVIGLEVYGSDALVRSLAVSADEQGNGYGSTLVRKLEAYAQSIGVKQLYLLTETADAFFSKKGFTTISRDLASNSMKHTRQFSELCPASAVLMRKSI